MRNRNVHAASSTLGAAADDVVTACIKRRAGLLTHDAQVFTTAGDLIETLEAEDADRTLGRLRRISPLVRAVWPDEDSERPRLVLLTKALLRRAAACNLDRPRLRLLQHIATVIADDTLAAARAPGCGSSRYS